MNTVARRNNSSFNVDDILKPVSEAEDRRRAHRVREQFWSTARLAARQIPFMEEVVAAYFCAMDSKTPFRVRATLLAALAYFVLPLDFVPDFILGIGFGDDIAVLTGAIAALRGAIKPAHRESARRALGTESAA